MAKPKPQAANLKVDDADAAFHRTEDLARRVLSVPKAHIDALMAKERAKKKRR